MTMKFPSSTASVRLLAAVVLATTLLCGCAPLIVGGAMIGGTMLATDRRTSGAQIEDKAIELKAVNRLRGLIGENGHVNVTSYNRTVLLTGEVPKESDRAAIEQTIARIENVHSLINELAVMGATSLASRSNDALLTTKVNATFVNTRDLTTGAFNVVTERAMVYLMGRVTEHEATRATELARSVPGVLKVVRVLEVISDAELAEMQNRDSASSKAGPRN